MAGISKKSPSFYRSSDPAENFKLKLQVRETSRIPLSDGDGSASKVGEGARKMGGSDGLGCRFDDDLFSWTAMQSFAMAAPWVPSLPDGVSRDVSNFEDIFDDEPEEVLAYDGDQAVFQGF